MLLKINFYDKQDEIQYVLMPFWHINITYFIMLFS